MDDTRRTVGHFRAPAQYATNHIDYLRRNFRLINCSHARNMGKAPAIRPGLSRVQVEHRFVNIKLHHQIQIVRYFLHEETIRVLTIILLTYVHIRPIVILTFPDMIYFLCPSRNRNQTIDC